MVVHRNVVVLAICCGSGVGVAAVATFMSL
jgi:hypothetical protein